jgi:hypothetical protein
MASITTRSGKGSALTFTEMDNNVTNLNTDKLENTSDNFTGELGIKGSGSSAVGAVRFHDNDDSHYVDLKAPATIGTNYTLTLPTTAGTSGQQLTTDGSGNLSWAAAGSGGGSSIEDADSDTSVNVETSSDADTIDFKVAGTTIAKMEATGLIPTVNSNGTTGFDLGSSSFQWRDLYVSNGSLYINGVKVIHSDATAINMTTDASSNQEIFMQPDGNMRLASTQGAVIVQSSNELKVDTIKGTGGDTIPQNLLATSFQSTNTSGMQLTAAKLGKPSGNMEIETALGGGEYIHLETNDAYIGTFATATRISDGQVSTAAGDLTLNTANGTNSGKIVVKAGADSDIQLVPNGDGKVKIPDDTKLRFGDDGDVEMRFRNSNSKFEQTVYGNVEIRASDAGASNKGNVVIRADNKMDLRAGTDKDSKGDLLLTSFDDFQFRKLGYQSSETDVAPTTNGTTSVTLSRSLTTGEQNALNDQALYFYDNSSFSSSDLRNMDNYIEVSGSSGSGSSTVLTLESAVSNLSNATHSAGRYLQTSSNSPVVVVDGTRGRLETAYVNLQNRMGFEGAQGRRMIMESVEFHDGYEYMGTGTGQSDEAEERPVSYEFGTTGGKNTFDLTHYTQTGGTYSSGTTIFKAKNRTTENSTVASKTTPDVMTFGVNPQLPSYTVASLPSGALAGEIAFCSDETGGAVMVFSDGTNWRRCTDRAIAS